MKILTQKEVWLRKTGVMNDFKEIEHGFDCLKFAWNSPVGARLRTLLSEIHPPAPDDLVRFFDSWYPIFRSQTFIGCISEHLAEEDEIGRLSMSRAYGGETPIAVVMNVQPFTAFSDVLRAYTSPVAYLNRDEFSVEFLKAIEMWESRKAELAQYNSQIVLQMLNVLRAAVLSTKHPGFSEEREWRIIYCPEYQQSEHLIHAIENIQGVPQAVYKIPLRNIPSEGLFGIEPHELIQRIIIGPTRHPEVVQEAFVMLLKKCGAPDAQNRVVISNIPLRR